MDTLIAKYLDSTLTTEEEKSLYSWVKENDTNLEYFKNTIYTYGIKDLDSITVDSEKSFENLKLRINKKETKVVSINWNTYLKYAAVIAVIVTSGFFFLKTDSKNIEQTTVTTTTPEAANEGIILKLADGTTKTLKEEELSYANEGSDNETLVYNELIVPKGEVFKVVLSDGTIVWLNADSKIKYPKYFLKNLDTREVVLEGEAFFDVTHNASQPFIVKTNDIDVQVLGTKFNVSSYPINTTVATTLVEGSVKVNEKGQKDNSLLITPSQQASFDKNSKGLSAKKVNVDDYIAWIEKRIVFKDMAFRNILTKIERAYDVDIVNNTNIDLMNEKFTGEFHNEDIEVIFKALSTTIDFEYEIINKQIIIKK